MPMTVLFKEILLLPLSLNDYIIINPQISRHVIRKLRFVFSPEMLGAVLSEFVKTMRWEVGCCEGCKVGRTSYTTRNLVMSTSYLKWCTLN